MKKIITILITLAVLLAMPIHATDGKATYSGNSGEFIFAPGSDYSPTDLFPNFKDIMPGDSITQKITVKNEASNNVKVKIYLRCLGSHEDSVDFLSQLDLRVKKSEDNEMVYMFDSTADKPAQLTDWVCLGMLYSGGEVNLDVILDVPVDMDNGYSKQIGYLDWEFMIEEFPVDPGDPQAPQTGDRAEFAAWLILAAYAGATVLILLFRRKKERNATN